MFDCNYIYCVFYTKSLISTYQWSLLEMPYLPRTSYGLASLGDDGDASTLFFA